MPLLHRVGRRRRETRSEDRMKLLLDLSRAGAWSGPEEVVESLASAAAAIAEAPVRLYLHDADARELWTSHPGSGTERLPDGGPLTAAMSSPRAVRLPGERGGDVAAPVRGIDGHALGVLLVEAHGQREPDLATCEVLAEQAAIGIQRFRSRRSQEQAADLRREMELARTVQAALVPSGAPRLGGLEAAGWTRSAELTGGDAFDLWSLPDGRLAVFVGDASGHGVAAALVIAQVRTLLRSLSELQADPEWLLARTNARLEQDLREGRFVTAFLGFFSATGALSWSSAGQGPLFVRRSAESGFETVQAPAVPLGIAGELVADAAEPVDIAPGGTVVVVSDGMLEARNGTGEMLGPSRLRQWLDGLDAPSAAVVLDALRSRLEAWEDGAEPRDDQTIVVVHRRA